MKINYDFEARGRLMEITKPLFVRYASNYENFKMLQFIHYIHMTIIPSELLIKKIKKKINNSIFYFFNKFLHLVCS